MFVVFFFFKQKTAYEMRISDWSSEVCSSDLILISFIDHTLRNIYLFDSKVSLLAWDGGRDMSIDTMELDTAGKVAAIPIDEIDVARPSLFQQDTIGLYFDRLRKEEPVHYCRESYVGPYWSIPKFDDILAVDTNHKAF